MGYLLGLSRVFFGVARVRILSHASPCALEGVPRRRVEQSGSSLGSYPRGRGFESRPCHESLISLDAADPERGRRMSDEPSLGTPGVRPPSSSISQVNGRRWRSAGPGALPGALRFLPWAARCWRVPFSKARPHVSPRFSGVESGQAAQGPFGAWRSLVARLLWEQKAGGSNPPAPTSSLKPDHSMTPLVSVHRFGSARAQVRILPAASAAVA